ncbi:MAG: hypothetical protein ACI4K7_09915 [Oscillospiraceae bacterium]
MNNDMFGSRGIAAAEQRVRNRNNMARQYTQMSNGGFAPMPTQGHTSAHSAQVPPPAPDVQPEPAPKPMHEPEKPAQRVDTPFPQMLSLPFGNIDTERLMLILLIALLSSEGADFVLIAALIYVMM